MHALVPLWLSKDNLEELVLCVGPMGQIQVIRLGNKCLEKGLEDNLAERGNEHDENWSKRTPVV